MTASRRRARPCPESAPTAAHVPDRGVGELGDHERARGSTGHGGRPRLLTPRLGPNQRRAPGGHPSSPVCWWDEGLPLSIRCLWPSTIFDLSILFAEEGVAHRDAPQTTPRL